MIKYLSKFLILATILISGTASAVLPNIFATQPSGNLAGSLLDTNFTFLESQGVQGFATTGSSNAYVATPADAWVTGYSSYVGRALTVVPSFTNTAASTVNVSGLGAVSLYKNVLGVATALASGDMVSGVPAILICDGTGFLLANPTAVAAATGAMVLLSTTTISSPTASASDTTHINSSYTHYIYDCSNFTTVNSGIDAYITVFQGAGYVGGTSYYSQGQRIVVGAIAVKQENGTAQFNIDYGEGGFKPTLPSTVKFEFWQPTVAQPLNIMFQTMVSAVASPEFIIGGGEVNTTAATTGIKITPSSGNIATATCNLYGIQ